MASLHSISSWIVGATLAFGSAARALAQSAPQPSERLTLNAAVDALVARNLAVLAARYNVDLFRAQRVAAALKPDPTVVLSATQLTLPRVVTHPAYAGVAVPDNGVLDTQFTVDVEKVVERGGKRELRVAQADIASQVAEAQLSNELRQQTYALKQAFLSALAARENLRVYRDNLRDFETMRRVFTAQVEEGYTAGVDLRRIGLELVELQGNMSTAHTTYAQGIRDVWNLIGDGERTEPAASKAIGRTVAATTGATQDASDTELDALTGDLNIVPVNLDLGSVRTLALANRPDLRAAQLERDAAASGVTLAQASRVRDVTVGGQYMRSGPDNAIGVALGVPLTTGHRADASIAAANAARLQADARFRQTKAQVLTDVEKAFVAYRASRERLHLFDGEILRQAAEVRNIEQVAYREGERGLLSFLDAQRAYNQTLLNYNDARQAFASSLYELESATGTDATRLAAGAAFSAPGGSHD